MAVNNINQVGRVSQTTGPQENQAPQKAQQERLELYKKEAFERGSSGFTDFRELQLVSDEQRAAYAAALSSISGEQRAAIDAASEKLAGALIEAGATGSTTAGLSNAGTQAIVAYVTGTGSDNLNDAMLGFMGMALGGLEQPLREMAEKVKYNNGLADELRTNISELQDILTQYANSWPPPEKDAKYTYVEVTFDKDGNPTVTEKTIDLRNLTKEEAKALRDKLEGKLSSLKDFNEDLKLQLQQRHEDVQKAVELFAQTQKDFHENAKAIINNLRA